MVRVRQKEEQRVKGIDKIGYSANDSSEDSSPDEWSDSDSTVVSSPDEFSDSDSSENSPPDEWIRDSDNDRGDDSPPRKQVELIGCSADDGEPGVSEDELLGQQLGALEKVQYFGTTASADDEQALQRAKNLFPGAFVEIDLKRWLTSSSYKCSCLYSDLPVCRSNPDCQKSIAIDPNYIKAYIHLGYIYYVQGIDAALEKGYGIATHLDPSNEYIRENVRAAEHKVWQQREESGQNSNWSYSSEVMSVRDQVPPPLFGNNSGAGLQISAMGPAITNAGELYAAIRAAYQLVGGVAAQDNNSNGN
ncbi:small glutamine-rich tetratricopeptide repeat-containing protein [Tanacetum coccineum]